HGARRLRLRSLAAGFPEPRPAGGTLRRHLRQRQPVPRPTPGTAPRLGPTPRHPEARRRALQFQPPWRERRRLERQPLRLLARLRKLEGAAGRGGLRRPGTLLPPSRPAARAAALAGERMAQARSLGGNRALGFVPLPNLRF